MIAGCNAEGGEGGCKFLGVVGASIRWNGRGFLACCCVTDLCWKMS